MTEKLYCVCTYIVHFTAIGKVGCVFMASLSEYSSPSSGAESEGNCLLHAIRRVFSIFRICNILYAIEALLLNFLPRFRVLAMLFHS